jgi:Tfp pilus assembly protein PilF
MALQMEPSLAEAHIGLARTLATEGKRDEAIRHYQEGLRLLRSQSAVTFAPQVEREQ